jgi:peptide/nickel transport system permease protein
VTSGRRRRKSTAAQRAGRALLVAIALIVIFAPWLAPHRAGDQLTDRAYAPPTRVRVFDASGLHAPFIHPQVMTDRLRLRFTVDAATRVPLVFGHGVLARSSAPDEPLLLFGADSLGRDVFARVVNGARNTLGVTLAGALGALLIGAVFGAFAAVAGGRTESWMMRCADFVLVLPAVYLVLVLRAMLPPVLATAEVFALMAALFALAAWPHVARGVRAIVAVELHRDYAEAARAAGGGRWRVVSHVLPATYGFLAAELILLVPALLSAEAALSYLGVGFAEPTPSWGTMLQEAGNVLVLRDAPWMLAPAAALFLVVLALQLAGATASTRAVFFDSLGSHASDPS